MTQNRAHLRVVPGRTPAADVGAKAPAPAPALDDTELLRALRAGDTTAGAALYDRARPQVERTLRRLLGRRDADYEDLAQLALIELVYTIHRYRGECSLDSWTSTITAHVVYKHIRRRKTERRIFSAASIDDLVLPAPPGGVSETMLRDVIQKVLVHLDAIDEARAWAFVLHDVCGYDLREIAQITGVSVAAAQSRLVRGRRELHERIQVDPDLASRLVGLEGRP